MSSPTTPEAFDTFDENLKLDPKERAAAETLHNEITVLLRSAGIIVYAFLQGSFARKTMIPPLRDVDKVVVLAEKMRGLNPDAVMDAIQAVISATYPNVTFERSRHALKADFGAETFYFDMVPAWETTTDDDDVLIANRETGGWDRSNTRGLIRTIAERNETTNGRFIHQARMGKQAIKNLLDGSVPGLHVESWAYGEITEPLPHDEAVARTLETGARLLGGIYYEPTGVDCISAKLKPEIIEAAKPILQKAAADARRARRLADAGDHAEAIRIWQGIFGDAFPGAAAGEEGFLSALHAGASVTAAGSTSTARTTPKTRAWRDA